MTKNKIKTILLDQKSLVNIIGLLALSSLIYYLPVLFGMFGWTSAEFALNRLHNLYGIDFLGLVYFAPVVYAAYVLGVIPAVLVALLTMLILLPNAIMDESYPSALFKPTAFVIILSA